MNSITISTYSINKLIEKIDHAISGGFKPTLAFIYVSPTYNIRKLVAEINKYSFLVLGATTVGEIFANSEAGVQEKEESIVCTLVEIDPSAIALKVIQVDGNRYFSVGEELSEWAKKEFANPAIITVTSGLSFDNDAYTQGIISKGVEYIFGAAAGDDLILKDTFVFSKENHTNHGIVALAVDRDKIELIGARGFGWVGIGKERIITKAVNNIVYEIDGKKAIDFYKKYLNVTAADMPQVGIEYPLEVTMRNGQVVFRAVLEINEELGALIFAGHVEEKSKIRLSSSKGTGMIENVTESIKDTLSANKGFEPELVLVFPCCSRKQVLGNLVIKEIETVYNQTKVPLVGFFAYGEIAASPGTQGFHNETFVSVLLSTKKEK
ncbi:MAG: Unknown protein [uncultured Sulfurovum sp.]|uniref:Histidine kinase n=1 Tax=uncultured Sulfurovum sp. TaxID=269237 RepID=A0A6S6TVC9_9BACT|nr:MAG: Unknown protein [uncultured Sulfurovum sp.]